MPIREHKGTNAFKGTKRVQSDICFSHRELSMVRSVYWGYKCPIQSIEGISVNKGYNCLIQAIEVISVY